MNNQKRRPFRQRSNKNNFRSRNGSTRSNKTDHFQNNIGNNFKRNGSMTNPFNVEKAIQKFQQLAKDAQSLGDPVLVENYLQHADHYSRRLAELNGRNKEETNSIKNPKENSIENNPKVNSKN